MADVPGTDATDDFGQGLALIQRMGGQPRPAVLDLFESIGESAFGEQCVGFIYGNVYHRPGLSLPERQLVTLGALTALGYAQSQLQFHAKAALNVGCTRQQVIEAIIEVSSVAGLPATRSALTAVRAAFTGVEDAELSADPAGQLPPPEIDGRDEDAADTDDDAGRRVVEVLKELTPDLARYVIESTGGGDPRTRLSRMHRELVTIAACTALGAAGPELKAHLHGLLNVGGTERVVVETLLHLAFYTGFPAALNAIGVAREVFTERAPA